MFGAFRQFVPVEAGSEIDTHSVQPACDVSHGAEARFARDAVDERLGRAGGQEWQVRTGDEEDADITKTP